MSRPATTQIDGPPLRAAGPIPRPRTALDDVPTLAGPQLSERDREVLRHLADGWSTPQIAAALSVTSNTARTRIRRVQRKLDSPERQQVVASARELGLL